MAQGLRPKLSKKIESVHAGPGSIDSAQKRSSRKYHWSACARMIGSISVFR